MKLVVAAVALDRLGAGYRYTTAVKQAPDGTLYLVGSGDPVLSSQAYLDAATAAAARNSASAAVGAAGGHPHARRAAGRRRGGGRRHPGDRRSWATTAATTASASCRRGRRATPRDLEAGPLGALMVERRLRHVHAEVHAGRRSRPQAAAEFAELLRQRGVTVGADPLGSGAGGCRRRGHVDPVAAAQRRGGGDDGHERQQHRRAAPQGDRRRRRRQRHPRGRARR